jgi:hypothetical protein
MVMNDVPEGYPYPPHVRFELDSRKLFDYRLAADFLNMNQVDVVCLQHEFGIFGGQNGRHILELLGNLRMPAVTTLHTVLKDPSPGQKTTVEEIGHVSGRFVVMSRKADRGPSNYFSPTVDRANSGLCDIEQPPFPCPRPR